MSTGYTLAYRFGLTPGERAGLDAAVQFNALLDREQQDGPPFGRALDIGCGTGAHALNLARRGWDVTAFDVVPRALDAARAKTAAAGLVVRYLQADATDMADRVGGGFALLLDVGPGGPRGRNSKRLSPTGRSSPTTPRTPPACPRRSSGQRRASSDCDAPPDAHENVAGGGEVRRRHQRQERGHRQPPR